MKDKLISFFFNTISLIVWAVTIAVLVTAVVMLCTGMEKPPVFTFTDVHICKASPEVLAENGREGEDWYAVEIGVRVAASPKSPFTYTAEGFEVGGAGISEDAFLIADSPELTFSKAQPQDSFLRYYVRYPDGPEALAGAAKGLAFRFTSYTGRFVFLKFPFRGGLPGFSLSEYEGAISYVYSQSDTPPAEGDEQITWGAAEPAA